MESQLFRLEKTIKIIESTIKMSHSITSTWFLIPPGMGIPSTSLSHLFQGFTTLLGKKLFPTSNLISP